MDVVVLIGVLAGLIGAGAGVFAIIWGLGLMEYMGGKKGRPEPPISREELKQKLLSVNSPDLPYHIKLLNETDLEIEWKITDASWFAIFGQERLQKTYRAFMVLDDLRRSVRYCEEMATVQWVASASDPAQPAISYQNQFFRGRILFQKSWEVKTGIKEDLTIGKVYEYKFDIRQVREPVKQLITDSGWEFVPVVRKKHATFKSLAM